MSQEETPSLFQRAIELYTPPFKFDQFGYINDAVSNVVADDHTEDAPGEVKPPLRVRGWGRMCYLPDPEQLQDQVGELIAQALNEFWMRNGGVAVYTPKYVLTKFNVDRNHVEVPSDRGRYVKAYEAEDLLRKLSLAEQELTFAKAESDIQLGVINTQQAEIARLKQLLSERGSA